MNYTNNILENNPDILQYIKDNQDLQHLLLNDPKTIYQCSPLTKSENFSHLHKLVLKTRKHEFLLHYLKLLLESEQQLINLQNKKGWTALMMACRYSNTNSNLETVKLLIKNGVNVNLQGEDGWTALMYACRYSNTDSNLDTVKLLIKNGANLNLLSKEGWSALMLAYRRSNTDNNLETIKLLIKNGANVNLQNQVGWSALMLACRNSNTVKLLIKNNADLNLQNSNGWSALMLACRNSNIDSIVETVKLLIEYQADINIQDPNGCTALMLSFFTNNLETIDSIINIFIKHGYVINKQEIYNFVIKFSQEIIVIDYLIDNKYLDYDGNLLKKYKNSKYNIMIPYYIFKKYNIITNECMICCNDTDCIKCNFDHYTCFMCLNKSNNKCHGCQLEL